MKTAHWVCALLAAGLVLSLGSGCFEPTFECSPATCWGCCDSTGECQLGNTLASCGTEGFACRTCTSAQLCTAGACVTSGDCTPSNCPIGCCANGVCLSGVTNNFCGRSGSDCVACPGGQDCVSRTCVSLGDGGTDGGKDGGSDGGKDGGRDGGPASCGKTNCPSGCCSGSGASAVCRPGSSGQYCGTGGAACQTCTSTQACIQQVCRGPGVDAGFRCNSMNCPTGCCAGFGQFSVCLLGNTSANCGMGGAQCRSCDTAVGQICEKQTCTWGTVDAGMSSVTGSPCSLDPDCASLGGNYRCKHFTNPGGASYPGGYCTRMCLGDFECAGDGMCVGLSAQYGENDRFCWKRCPNGNECRSPGYTCYSLNNNNGCWLFPLPSADAGAPADKIGRACTLDSQCQNPPANGFCFPPAFDGGTTGYLNGYCSAPCSSNPSCGDGGVCVAVSFGPQSVNLCHAVCPGAGTGQSTCRPGYLCDGPLTPSPDAGFGRGACRPSCLNSSLGCPWGTVCQATGYCR
ncbi:MAG: hypothetical protein ACYC8T_13490 [Myxococcaceae bacterium]